MIIFSIFMIIRKFKLSTTWVGLNDIHEENKFVWAKDSFKGVGFKKWCPNQPDNKNHRENCVELTAPNHCLSDIKCGSDRPFICEINDESTNVSYFGH